MIYHGWWISWTILSKKNMGDPMNQWMRTGGTTNGKHFPRGTTNGKRTQWNRFRNMIFLLEQLEMDASPPPTK